MRKVTRIIPLIALITHTQYFPVLQIIYHENVQLFSVSVSPPFPPYQPILAQDVSRKDGCCGTRQQKLSGNQDKYIIIYTVWSFKLVTMRESYINTNAVCVCPNLGILLGDKVNEAKTSMIPCTCCFLWKTDCFQLSKCTETANRRKSGLTNCPFTKRVIYSSCVCT